jgi:hypothetical protein
VFPPPDWSRLASRCICRTAHLSIRRKRRLSVSGLNTRRSADSRRWRAILGLSILSFGLSAANGHSNQNELPQYSRDVWDESRGYPGGRIYGTTQTTDGYLWIGTDRGLIRFDGSTFRVFQQMGSDRTRIGSVFALAGDPQGNLLISTLLGLQRLQLRNDELEELPPLFGQPADPLSAIYQEHNGNVLIATVRRGMISYDGKRFRALPGPHLNVTAAAQARDGTLWMGTATQGLFAYPYRRILDRSEDIHHVRINALLPFGEHGVTVGTEKGLWQWDGTNMPARLWGPSDIQVMLEDRQGNLWLGCTQGLYRIGSGSVTGSILPYSRYIVTYLYEDRAGDVWAGTSTGLVRVRHRILTTYPLGPDLAGSI